MIGRKSRLRLAGITLAALSMIGFSLGPAEGAGHVHPATGVGSCTLNGWNPGSDPEDAKDLPSGDRYQSYKPDDFNCSGAVFAAPGAEFKSDPQPKNFDITNKDALKSVKVCQSGACGMTTTQVAQPTAAVNPLAPMSSACVPSQTRCELMRWSSASITRIHCARGGISSPSSFSTAIT